MIISDREETVYSKEQITLNPREYEEILSQIEADEQTIKTLYRKIEESNKELERAKEEIENLYRNKEFIEDLAANPNLSSSEKWALWGAMQKISQEEGQYTEIDMWEIAKSIGMSTAQTGTLLKKLTETGGLARTEKKEKVEGSGRKPYRTRISL